MTEEDGFAINKRISLIFSLSGLSISEFGSIVGMSRQRIAQLISNKNLPSTDSIIKIVKVFPFLSLDYILLGEGDVTRHPEDSTMDIRQRFEEVIEKNKTSDK